jgi:rare lipoprotein A
MHSFCGKLILLLVLLTGVGACSPKVCPDPKVYSDPKVYLDPKVYQVQVHDSAETKNLKGHQKPYSVNGELYEPLRDHSGYREEGTASWYGPDFHGKATSCGEIYDMNAMTSAHKILPMGTKLRVTNLRNNRSIEVRVNDRGPFVKSRILDLSYAAAKELDIVASGTAPVRIESIAGSGLEMILGPFTVQVGAFTNPENAYRLASQLEKRYGSSSVQRGWVNGTLFHRVRVGRYAEIEAAEAVRKEFEGNGTPAAFVVALDKS